ncbi:MAG: N-6 DNA methylase [Ferruginibacter sp.]
MSEELLQRDLLKNPAKVGKWDFYNIGATTIKALKEHNIIRHVDYGEIEKKKVDGIIVFRKTVIAIIEYKKPSAFKTKAQQEKAIQQEIEVAKKLHCKLLIATDTKETVWVNCLTGKRINDEEGLEIKENFNIHDEKIVNLIVKINYSINELNNNIKPKQLVNPTGLARQIWQDIWTVSGATPENCLYTFVELFIFKYLSDLEVLRGIYNFNTLITSFETNNPDEILENYASVIRPKIKDLFPENPIDKTTIINGTIFVSKDQKAVKGYSTVFKKVLLRFKDYGKLEHIDYDFKSQLFESFLKESISKKNWGQFFTPLKVVRAIVEMAKDEIKDGVKICDPACGVGKFLLEPIVTKLDYLYTINKKSILPKITIHGYDKGFDKDEQKTIILAKANMLIYFSDLIKDNPGLTKEFAKLFNESFVLKTNSILGTLSDATENEYDLILTNPPYVTSGSSNLKEEIKKDGDLVSHYKISALGVEGLFMEWIIKALKPNGKAYVVIPDGMLIRQNDKHLRKFLLDECFIDGLISLPLNTFFTTNKKTYVLSVTKKSDKKVIQTDPVFTYLVSEIGEKRDVYRFDIDQNDLNEAVTLYSFFKGNKNAFAKINNDNRCKVIPASFFIKNVESNWVIDKLWTEEEKINLGIRDKNETVSLFEFSSIIEDVASTIKSFQDEVTELAEKKKPNLKFQAFKLKDLFDIFRGLPKYTKGYGNLNKGSYAVYSASNRDALTHINTFDFDGEFLTWSTNGFAGYIKVMTGKFSINGDRGLLKKKDDLVNIYYVKLVVQPLLRGLARGRKGEKGEDEFTKVYPSMISDIEIDMPIDENGLISESAQEEIVEKFRVIADIYDKIEEYKKRVVDLEVEILNDETVTKSFNIEDIFKIVSGNAALTKKYVDANKGSYVAYSANTKQNGEFGHISTYDHDLECIQITTNGVYAGTIFYREKHKFSINGDAKLLVPKTDKVYYPFLVQELRSVFKTHNFNWENKPSLHRLKNIQFALPVLEDGEIDYNTQKEIADKIEKVGEIKRLILRELDKITQANVVVD